MDKKMNGYQHYELAKMYYLGNGGVEKNLKEAYTHYLITTFLVDYIPYYKDSFSKLIEIEKELIKSEHNNAKKKAGIILESYKNKGD